MNDNVSVTGGDLLDLWKIAHINLPNVRSVYVEACRLTHLIGDTSDGIAKRYGRTQPAWSALIRVYEQVLWSTHQGIKSVEITMDGIIDEFKEIDEAAAKDLESQIDDPMKLNQDDKLTGDEIPGTPELPRWSQD